MSKADATKLLDAMSEIDVLRFAQLVERDRTALTWDASASIAFIGYEPNFVLQHEAKDEKKANAFMKTRKARVLAELWTETLKQVLLDVGFAGEFVAGFTWSDTARASFNKDDGIPYFYLNPEKLCADNAEVKNPYVSRVILKKDILMCACHEITHMKEQYHDGSFVNRLEWVHAQTWKSENIYTKIMARAFRKDI